jgi:hypothetical protein
MKHLTGLAPAAFIYQVVKVRDRVIERTARTVTKRYSAVHTAGRLLPDFIRRKRQVHLGKIPDSLLNRPMPDFLSLIF